MSVYNNTHAIDQFMKTYNTDKKYEEFTKTYDTEEKLVKEFGYVYEYLYGKKKDMLNKKVKELKDTNIVYDFISFDEKIPSLSDIITHIIIFKRNESEETINHIEITNENDEIVDKFDIIWDNDYGLVNLRNKWLNMIYLSKNNLKFSTKFSNNYKLYIGQVLIGTSGHKQLGKLDYLIDKINNEPKKIRYLSDNKDNNNVIFNAVDISNYKSLKLKIMMGTTRINLTKNKMIAYKKYVNKKYFLLSTELWHTGFVKDVEDFYSKLHEKMGLPSNEKTDIELETVRIY
jgi:hypothetical protein